jgi:hypothetical protein
LMWLASPKNYQQFLGFLISRRRIAVVPALGAWGIALVLFSMRVCVVIIGKSCVVR